MIDIKLIRENKDLVKENIKKKFQNHKLVLVDEIYELDIKFREYKTKGDTLKFEKKALSDKIGSLMKEGLKEEALKIKEEVSKLSLEIVNLNTKEEETSKKMKELMMVIPNIMDASVPIGEDDSKNVVNDIYGEIVEKDFEIPYHADILNNLGGIDKDSAGRTSGNGFYYLMGDCARLHSAMLAYARDFMIDSGYTYCLPPFMIRSDVVTGVMSFEEMDAMMYKIEGEDLYLIGTSEHSTIGRYKNQILNEKEFPIKLTSYSPCFRKEVGAHGIEERGIYRVHQFEKQEMVVLCKPEDSMNFYEQMWKLSVKFFESLDIPVRTLECCSGDLADLKVKSVDIEAYSPRQKSYFEVGSCSTLGDAQARRLGIRVKSEDKTYFPHTLNNTVLATPRALIAFVENNVNKDGSINVPPALRPYMGGKEVIK